MNEGSDVHSCLIDAAKLLTVHWGGGGAAFSILIEKKVSYSVKCHSQIKNQNQNVIDVVNDLYKRTNYLLSDSSFTERCAVSNIFNSFFVRCGDNDNGLFSKFILRMEYSRDRENIYYIHLPHIYNNEQEL